MKRIAILGSTGSIGTQTLDVVRQHPDRLKVVALAAGSNAEALSAQAAEFGVNRLALFQNPSNSPIPTGLDAVNQLVARADVDLVVVSVAGVIGLVPTLTAIEAGKDIALASKEVLVAGGEIVMARAKANGIRFTPIDSEHSAIFQCLEGYRSEQIAELIITASGGPFRGKRREELQKVTVEQALNHPTWRMGGKITIDSATLMNKALELIEAKWLFEVAEPQVKVVVHPQSVVHSLVKFHDGSVLGQFGWPNMRLPIQYALLYPDRVPSGLKNWDPIDTPNLTFEPVDEETFPAVRLAREALRSGGTMPCALNAANEAAANAFLAGKLSFMDIVERVERVMSAHMPEAVTIPKLLEVDAWARELALR